MPKHFSVDTTRLRWLERELKSFAEDRMPKAARGTLNGMADRTRVLWRREAKESMILRAPTRSKPWALTSIRYDKARGTHMDSMRATTGSEAEFMAQQEAGGERGNQGGQTVAVRPAPGEPLPGCEGQGLRRGRRNCVARSSTYRHGGS